MRCRGRAGGIGPPDISRCQRQNILPARTEFNLYEKKA